jgi:hypothetical protein
MEESKTADQRLPCLRCASTLSAITPTAANASPLPTSALASEVPRVSRRQALHGIWFKSVIPAKDFDCRPDASMSACKAKEGPSGKRYYYGVQLRGPQAVPLLDP